MAKKYDIRINVCRRERRSTRQMVDGTVVVICCHNHEKFNLPERAVFVEEDDRLYFYPSDKGYKLSGGYKYQLGSNMAQMFERYQGTAFLHFDEEAGMYYIVRSEITYFKEYRNSRPYKTRSSKPKKEETEDMAVVKVKPVKETENFVIGAKEEWLNNVCATCRNYDICKYAQSVDELRETFNNLPVTDFLTIKVECKYRR